MAKVSVSISFDPETINLLDRITDNRSGTVNKIVKCCLQVCKAQRCRGLRAGREPKGITLLSR